MRKETALIAIAGAFLAFAAHAEPVSLSEAQMDGVTAGGVETVEGFVCPVFNDEAIGITNNPNAVLIGEGDYSIIGPEVTVPARATNGGGSGLAGGSHSDPGDRDYTAIWGHPKP
jgi:hypothetical protein